MLMKHNNPLQSRLFASAGEIDAVVGKLAEQIRQDYKDRELLLVGILKGSFIFLADLSRKLGMNAEIDFIGLSSYGEGRVSSGNISLYYEPRLPVAGRDVVLVEDIVDSGLSTFFAINYLKKKGANSVKLCALLDKKCRREVEVHIDYAGFSAPDRFLVGYGLDCDECFRNLCDINMLGEE